MPTKRLARRAGLRGGYGGYKSAWAAESGSSSAEVTVKSPRPLRPACAVLGIPVSSAATTQSL